MKKKYTFLLLVFLSLQICLNAQISPVALGRASNVFTIISSQQNQVFASDMLNSVVFIHRQDLAVWTGESGQFRYDLSTDGGKTFTNDIGILNSTNLRPGRYPQITGFNPNGSTDPFETKLVWAGPTLFNNTWGGNVNGLSELTATAPPNTTENYDLLDEDIYISTGLCQGKPGEFWMITRSFDGFLFADTIKIIKGIYNEGTDDLDWSISERIFPNNNPDQGGSGVRLIELNLAFSPDGNIGWAAYLGDLTGTGDSGVLSPVLIPTFDGGSTWGDPIEVDLRAMNFIGDFSTIEEELQQFFFVDSLQTTPFSTGQPSCAFEFDIAVDSSGAPHFFVVIGSGSVVDAPDPSYSVYSGLPMMAVDIYTKDGGATWEGVKIANINKLRGSFGMPQPVIQDNYPQISRSQDGSHIFFSWVDTEDLDENNNSAPDLNIAGLRISDNYRTCPEGISQADPIWGGKALWPTMAPEVLIDENGIYNLPIVALELLSDDANSSCAFWYFGNDATLSETDFIASPSQTDNSCTISCLAAELNPGFSYNFSGLNVEFMDTSSFSGVAPVSWLWDFGDGNFSNNQNPQHNFPEMGSYEVCLQLSNRCTSGQTCQTIVVGTTGLNEIDNAKINIYPNPAENMIWIELDDVPLQPVQFGMYSITGQMVQSRSLSERVSIIDLSGIPAGMYLARLKSTEGGVTRKILVE